MDSFHQCFLVCANISCFSGRIQTSNLQEKKKREINCLPPILLHGNAPQTRSRPSQHPLGLTLPCARVYICASQCCSPCVKALSLLLADSESAPPLFADFKNRARMEASKPNVSLESCGGGGQRLDWTAKDTENTGESAGKHEIISCLPRLWLRHF